MGLQEDTSVVLTEEALAERWGFEVKTLRNMRGRKTGPRWFRPTGAPRGPVRYRLEDVEEWEENNVGPRLD